MTLEEFERLMKKATPGPWMHEKHESDSVEGVWYSGGHVVSRHHSYAGNAISRRDSVTDENSMTFADGEFIAACRDMVPQLLDRIRATKKLLTAWRYKTGPCPACHSTIHAADCVLVRVMDALAGIEKPRTADGKPHS